MFHNSKQKEIIE